ncbi:MAG: flagellin lysine-N-methylase [Bacteroidales bacterium]|nr:flagellin lysine-N-methylase [Candidatus Cacconaster equi]
MYKAFYPPYGKFKCIADKCPIGCCFFRIYFFKREESQFEENEVWRNIDKKGNGIAEYLDKDDIGFFIKQQKNGNCIFLNDRRLCEIQLKHGPDSGNLPCLCRTYPRLITTLDDRIEYALEPCCPVAAASVKEWDVGTILIVGEKSGSIDQTTVRRDKAMQILSDRSISLRDCLIALNDLYKCGKEIPEFTLDHERTEFIRKETALMVWAYLMQYDGVPEVENLMEFIISVDLSYIDIYGQKKYDSWWDMCVEFSRHLLDRSIKLGFIMEHEERYGDINRH